MRYGEDDERDYDEQDGTDFGPDGPRGDYLADYWANFYGEPYEYDEEYDD